MREKHWKIWQLKAGPWDCRCLGWSVSGWGRPAHLPACLLVLHFLIDLNGGIQSSGLCQSSPNGKEKPRGHLNRQSLM